MDEDYCLIHALFWRRSKNKNNKQKNNNHLIFCIDKKEKETEVSEKRKILCLRQGK